MTPETIEQFLSDARDRLYALASANGAADNGAAEVVDLRTLLEQLVTLRQEVRIQIKAARGQQEDNATALRLLRQLAEAQPRAVPTPDGAIKPLLQTLLSTYDALELAWKEVNRVQATLQPALERLAAPPRSAQGLWTRWFAPPRPNVADDQAQAVAQASDLLSSLQSGYAMSLQRVERALQQQGLEPIQSVGEPFDPELMEAVDVVAVDGDRAGTVVSELRRGYVWQGRVFRCALVQVAK